MPESDKKDRRVISPAGEQSKFLLRAKKSLKLSWQQFAEKIGVHRRTLNDWKREKYSLPFNVLKKVSTVAKLKIPRNIEIRRPFWYVYRGGRAGGLAVYKKYGRIGGDPEYRKKKWYEWWEKKGKYNTNLITAPKPIRKPDFSEDLAEFVGIMIGDGGITKKQVRVSLGADADRDYGLFVKNFIKKLFGVEPSIYFRKNSSEMEIIVSRTLLVEFCVSIGLKLGNKLKQNLDVPRWIKGNRAFETVCLRGLMDTDGCIFNECHRIKNKNYCYPRLAFVSSSRHLRFSVFKILKEFGFLPKIRNNRSVQLEKRNDIVRYFDVISTNNPKHKRRFESFLGRVG